MTLSAIHGKLDSSINDDESRWWRMNVLCCATSFLLVATAFSSIKSGHTYWCAAAPVLYLIAWNSLSKSKNIFVASFSAVDVTVRSKFMAELASAVTGLNLVLLILVIFFIRRP
ncbi:MAG: hypothetical protein PW792_07460 [Acidobacteriaceae bacterium]|nr:hypothetical protein [Acidobacteriaceae bacterium]